MSESDNAGIIRRWLDEVWNQKRDASVHELMDPQGIGHLEGLVTRNVDEFLRARSYILNAFPDLRLKVEAMIAKGDQVVVRWSVKGTHRGELLGIPASGNPISFRGITWFVVSNGRIVEGWDVWNQGRLLAELRGVA